MATRQDFPRAVSFCTPLTPRIVAAIADGPTEEYCDEYDRTNALLTGLAEQAAAWLTARGHRASPQPATHNFDRQTLRAPFQHKTAATLSGLAWIGKCDLAVTPQYGSAVRWASILTEAPLPTAEPIVESRCGDCRACVDVCPGRACSGTLWRQGMAREDHWDPWACVAGMKKINQGRTNHHGLCGMCIAACPLTRAYLKRAGAA